MARIPRTFVQEDRSDLCHTQAYQRDIQSISNSFYSSRLTTKIAMMDIWNMTIVTNEIQEEGE